MLRCGANWVEPEIRKSYEAFDFYPQTPIAGWRKRVGKQPAISVK
jgi:hypothetical protein